MADFELPTRFPYLDSDAYADERFGSAERRRMMILQNNCLAGPSQHAFNIIGNRAASVEETYKGAVGIRGYGSPNWVQICSPRIIRKTPGLNRIRIRARIEYPENGAWADNSAAARLARGLTLQITNNRYPFKDNATPTTHQGTVFFQQDGSTDYYVRTIENMPCDEGMFDVFRFYIKGGLTRELMDESTYGVNNQGIADNHTWLGPRAEYLRDGTSAWQQSIIGKHWLELDDHAGQYNIIGVASPGGAQTLEIHPHSSVMITSQAYSIYDLHPWKLFSVAGYFQRKDR